MGMHPHDFDNLLGSIDRATFKSDKMDRVRMAKHNNNFTCDQVRQIMLHLTFDSDREDAAVMLYPNVVDKGNWYMVYDAFTFSSSGDSVNRRLGI